MYELQVKGIDVRIMRQERPNSRNPHLGRSGPEKRPEAKAEIVVLSAKP